MFVDIFLCQIFASSLISLLMVLVVMIVGERLTMIHERYSILWFFHLFGLRCELYQWNFGICFCRYLHFKDIIVFIYKRLFCILRIASGQAHASDWQRSMADIAFYDFCYHFGWESYQWIFVVGIWFVCWSMCL